MSWSYRLVYRDDAKPPYYAVHEVYYRDDGTVRAWTVEPVGVSAVFDLDDVAGPGVVAMKCAGQLNQQAAMVTKDILERPMLRMSEMLASAAETEPTQPGSPDA